MAVKVLIVDDSTFFRKRLTEIIKADPALEVCGEAKDGKEGVDMAIRLKPDVITMDVEMPVMDGITAVKEIMQKAPTPILMFSSLTLEGANATFRALEAGAVDFMPKNFDDIAHRREDALNELRSNIKAVARSRVMRRPSASSASSGAAMGSRMSSSSSAVRGTASNLRTSSPQAAPAASNVRSFGTAAPSSLRSASNASAAPLSRGGPMTSTRLAYEKIQSQLESIDQGRPAAAMQFSFGNHAGETTKFRPSGKTHEIIAIGSSTGGPIALQNIIPKLPVQKVPIIIVQHMPPAFTTTFAQRLDNMSKVHVVEAKDGMMLEPNTCYIAPGGLQMIFEKTMSRGRIRILKGDDRIVYHPCVDVSFASLAQVYGGRVLAMILTGMGSDGCEGCRLLKKAGSVIWAQNEESCVVYGMPQAVVNARLAEQVLPLDQIADCICEEMR